MSARLPGIRAFTGLLAIATLFLFAGVTVPVASGKPPAAGLLKPQVSADPWSFRLTDGNGEPVLTELAATADTPAGTLGFRVGDTWHHAIRVTGMERDGAATTYQAETTDPAHGLEVTVERLGPGSVRLKAEVTGPDEQLEAVGIGFEAPAGERYLGFGERSNSVNQRGNAVESWTAEGPYGKHEGPLVATSVPAWGMRTGTDGDTRPDSTYYPVPWLLSTAGYGVLVEDSRPSYFRVGSDREDAWSVEVARRVDGLARMPADPPPVTGISLRFFSGPKPAGVINRMTAATGRQPEPAPWFLGPWVQSKGGDESTAARLRENDVPTSVMQTYTHYLPCGDENTAAERARTGLFHENGMAVTTYFNPMVCTGYNPVFNDLKNAGGLTLDEGGQPYTYDYLGYNVGEIDFSSPAGRHGFGELLEKALGDGYDGWMEDFGEYHPPDSVISDGTPGMIAHNRYPREYHCTAFDKVKNAGRPVLRYVRSGFTGSAACSPVVWGGDPSTVWDFDGLKSAITNGLTMGLSGVGVWGSDIGGFFTILSPDLTPELLSRWIQFGAFSGVMRDQADGYIVGAGRTRAQILAPEQIETWRRYSKLRTQLYPYIRGAAAEYRATGMPLMRALPLQFPNDRKAAAIEDQFMFGPGLMVAPVTEPGATSRKVYLPRGRWFDLWRSFKWNRSNGYRLNLLRSARVAGGGWRELAAPAGRIPVLAKAGTVLVTLPDRVDTLAPYGANRPGIRRLADTPARRILAFPAGRSSTRFEATGRVRSRERAGKGVWRLVIRDTRRRSWQMQAALGSLNRPFKPRCLKVNGKRRPVKYRANGRRLTIRFEAKSKKTVIAVRKNRCQS